MTKVNKQPRSLAAALDMVEAAITSLENQARQAEMYREQQEEKQKQEQRRQEQQQQQLKQEQQQQDQKLKISYIAIKEDNKPEQNDDEAFRSAKCSDIPMKDEEEVEHKIFTDEKSETKDKVKKRSHNHKVINHNLHKNQHSSSSKKARKVSLPGVLLPPRKSSTPRKRHQKRSGSITAHESKREHREQRQHREPREHREQRERRDHREHKEKKEERERNNNNYNNDKTTMSSDQPSNIDISSIAPSDADHVMKAVTSDMPSKHHRNSRDNNRDDNHANNHDNHHEEHSTEHHESNKISNSHKGTSKHSKHHSNNKSNNDSGSKSKHHGNNSTKDHDNNTTNQQSKHHKFSEGGSGGSKRGGSGYSQPTLSSRIREELTDKQPKKKEKDLLSFVPVGSQGKSYHVGVIIQKELGQLKSQPLGIWAQNKHSSSRDSRDTSASAQTSTILKRALTRT